MVLVNLYALPENATKHNFMSKKIGTLKYQNETVDIIATGEMNTNEILFVVKTKDGIKSLRKSEVLDVEFNREEILRNTLGQMQDLVNKLPWTPLIFMEKALERSIEDYSSFRRNQAEEALEMARGGVGVDPEILNQEILKQAIKLMESVINLIGPKITL